MAAGVALVFLGVVGAAKATGHWDTAVPDWLYSDLIPKARDFGHP